MVRDIARLIALGLWVAVGHGWGCAQENGDPKAVVEAAVKAELAAHDNDHARWRYRDLHKDANNSLYIVVETDHGSVKRLVGRGGALLNSEEAREEDAKVASFINDHEKLAKQRKDAAQDDKNARELTTMLPNAFKWKIESEDGERVTLHFEPNPGFDPPDMQSRVLGAMAGKLVVDKKQHRIVTMSGKLTEDVTIGWGLLGRLHEGGTFRVERREVSPGLWQITETHVHIEGKVLFFKNIGQQQDEVQSEFTQVPAGTTLEQAAAMTKPGGGTANGTTNASVK
jgi:hypothetical protein